MAASARDPLASAGPVADLVRDVGVAAAARAFRDLAAAFVREDRVGKISRREIERVPEPVARLRRVLPDRR